MKNIKILLVTVLSTWATFTWTLSAQASFLSVNETAEILPENFYKVGVAPQLLISNGGGFNIGVFADMHAFDDTDARISFGAGEIDFYTQASLKWVPFPDVDKQPAIGLKGGLGYVRENSENFLQIQITPLISKKADTRYGNMIPYVALPITYMNTKNDNYTATQFTVGSEWYPYDDKHIGAELNLNMKNSYSSISVYFSFPFEASTGYIRK